VRDRFFAWLATGSSRRPWAVLAVALAAPALMAGELAGVTMPDQVTVAGKTLQLNGMGVRKKLWIKVYVGGLYLEKKTHSAEEALDMPGPKRMVMHFLTKKATKKRMDSAWDEGFEKNAPKVTKVKIEKFKAMMGDMHPGDVVIIQFVPGEGTHVIVNGKDMGVIEGDDFARGVFSIYLGPEPPTEDLKNGLLGKG
jgi:hypothetical protein